MFPTRSWCWKFVQHHYVNNSILVSEKGIGAIRNIVHVNVIVDDSPNDLGDNGCFITINMFIIISNVFGFDVVIQENTMG